MTRRRRNRDSWIINRAGRRVRMLAHRSSPVVTNNPEQFVDLTCEDATDNDQYVDLTAASIDNTIIDLDTPTFTRSGSQRRRRRVSTDENSSSPVRTRSPLLLSDSSNSDAELPELTFAVRRKPIEPVAAGASCVTPPGVLCPICLDGINYIKTSSRQIMTTTCGHVFCSDCMRGILANRDGAGSRCPTCRKKLTAKSVHKLFI